jgi:hypothetical protein
VPEDRSSQAAQVKHSLPDRVVTVESL